ncbi:MAG: molybdopterin-dependent oxidoreductase [Yoonia sp.]|uniref:molybdopterin-dependent oxidoreductase n=1 Tax=Yoonia sp. TaxID=2212373 RepID=UPI003EF13714
MSNVIKAASVAAVLFACSPTAYAQDSAAPILTVSGTVIEGEASYDREALMQLPVTTIETSTIWTDGVSTFTGVSLADLVAELGAEGGTIVATAVNDYAVEIPIEDAVEGGPIVAYLMDDQEMSLRDKGPLWVVYPYDSDASYRSEVIYSRSIWQLDRLEFLD